MTLKAYAVFFTAIVVVAAGIIINTMQYEQEITQLQTENNELQALQVTEDSVNNDKEQKNRENYLSVTNFGEVETLSYEDWGKNTSTAQKMVENSENQFQESWALFLTKKAREYDIDPFIVYELIKIETGGTFDPELVGPPTKYGHAYGLSQFMENTAPWIAEMADLPYEKDLLFNPEYSIELSVVYLDFLYGQYGNWDEALTAYHRGIGGLEQYIGENGNAASWYAVEIQEEAEKRSTFAVAQ
ncbi:transglycosylase SLT domain-containing protein [Halalkalibacillus halophilus]|uniref:transglycosylase SLT domain-containing protein n=1 Tax=Halalkalibacillus halophilus TaxID=392827 RepID=UPI00040D5300|nr:transglycosylase SLT domain-containing protein [Halalkalibacillus halophilus]